MHASDAALAAPPAPAVPPEGSPRRAPGFGALSGIGYAAWGGAVVLFLFAAAMTGPTNYDEDQYIAAGVMAGRLRLYADFLYLQPPAYPLLLAPVFEMVGGHYLLTGRLVTWACSVGACALLARICRRLGAGGVMTGVLVTASVLSASLLGPMSNTRNDILPLLLLLAGLDLLLRTHRHPRWPRRLLAAAGLCLGLAVQAKLSYAFAPFCAGACLLLQEPGWRAGLRSRLLPFALGAALASLPSLGYLLLAPEAFLYGVLEYHVTAPIAWYARQGQGDLLTLGYRLAMLLALLALGGNATLVILATTMAVLRRTAPATAAPRPAERADRRLLLSMLGGALILASLPSPPWPMYFAPVTALLACWVAFAQGRLRGAGHRVVPLAIAAGVLAALPAARAPVEALARLPDRESWVGLAAHRQALAVREEIRRLGEPGHVATLFPMQVLDANPVRPEFATGPFVFRTAGSIPAERLERLHAASPAVIDRLFAADPPAAIFGAIEPGRWAEAMDAALFAYAERHGYLPVSDEVRQPAGIAGRLYIRPRQPGEARR